VVRISQKVSVTTWAVTPGWDRATPSSNEAPTTGMVITPADWSPSVPTFSAMRPGSLPWLKMTSASAPASWALRALTAKSQVPRWLRTTSAGLLRSRPAKSAGSQPLVLARSPSRLMSTGTTGPVTSPVPENSKVPVS
jgi:hypothetical protein